MTFLAGYLSVHSSQRIPRLRVVEFGNGHILPVVVVVALQAVLAKPSVVFIAMTSRAAR